MSRYAILSSFERFSSPNKPKNDLSFKPSKPMSGTIYSTIKIKIPWPCDQVSHKMLVSSVRPVTLFYHFSSKLEFSSVIMIEIKSIFSYLYFKTMDRTLVLKL